MVIVLVKWKIKPGREDEFLKRWREEYKIEDRRGFVGEFMCEPGSQGYITWSLPDPEDPPCKVFVNVGIWADDEAFREQVEPKFNDDKEPEPFEAGRRVRTVLHPTCRRIGNADLPSDSSVGVL